MKHGHITPMLSLILTAILSHSDGPKFGYEDKLISLLSRKTKRQSYRGTQGSYWRSNIPSNDVSWRKMQTPFMLGTFGDSSGRRSIRVVEEPRP